MADIDVNQKYETMRELHGTEHASANGYVTDSFFRREQRFLIERLRPGKTLDAACGSALMLENCRHLEVIGLDFNMTACQQAQKNKVSVIRGDVFNLPFANDSFTNVINCQFLNQQPGAVRQAFLSELARVTEPGGHCHILWRGADTLIHRIANWLDNTLRQFQGKEIFPQHFHEPHRLMEDAVNAGFKIDLHVMTLPFGPSTVTPGSISAKVFGASYYIRLVKTESGHAT